MKNLPEQCLATCVSPPCRSGSPRSPQAATSCPALPVGFGNTRSSRSLACPPDTSEPSRTFIHGPCPPALPSPQRRGLSSQSVWEAGCAERKTKHIGNDGTRSPTETDSRARTGRRPGSRPWVRPRSGVPAGARGPLQTQKGCACTRLPPRGLQRGPEPASTRRPPRGTGAPGREPEGAEVPEAPDASPAGKTATCQQG